MKDLTNAFNRILLKNAKKRKELLQQEQAELDADDEVAELDAETPAEMSTETPADKTGKYALFALAGVVALGVARNIYKNRG